MSKKFSDYIIITDLDGTLLTSKKQISSVDLNAINEFVDGGGEFAVATGRVYESALPYINKLPVTIPCIMYNGGMIYDTINNEILWKSMLPDESLEYLKEILDEFSYLGAEILINKEIYIPQYNDILRQKMIMENVTAIECKPEEIPAGWIKVLFTLEEHKFPEVTEFIKSKCYNGVSFVESFGCYYEMLPLGVSKGSAITKLLEIRHINNKKIVCIGDYNNDIEMIKTADIGVCVSNSPKEVKDSSDLILRKTSDEGAIAELIQYLSQI